MIKSLFLGLALVVAGLVAFADEVKTPPLGLTHLHLGGGVYNVLTASNNTNTLSGAASSTFYWRVATNSVAANLSNFVDGQQAQIWIKAAGTGVTTVTFRDTGLVFNVASNESAVVFASLTDSTYRTAAITNFAVIKP